MQDLLFRCAPRVASGADRTRPMASRTKHGPHASSRGSRSPWEGSSMHSGGRSIRAAERTRTDRGSEPALSLTHSTGGVGIPERGRRHREAPPTTAWRPIAGLASRGPRTAGRRGARRPRPGRRSPSPPARSRPLAASSATGQPTVPGSHWGHVVPDGSRTQRRRQPLSRSSAPPAQSTAVSGDCDIAKPRAAGHPSVARGLTEPRSGLGRSRNPGRRPVAALPPRSIRRPPPPVARW